MARGRGTQECFQGLREACDDAAFPYRTVTRWIKTFREGKYAVHDKLRTGRPQVENNIVQLLASVLDADRRWSSRGESSLRTKPGLTHLNQLETPIK